MAYSQQFETFYKYKNIQYNNKKNSDKQHTAFKTVHQLKSSHKSTSSGCEK